MAYLLDANIFIQASNLHYGFDFCPAFWDWLHQANGNQQVFSLTQVKDELTAGNDELSNWADQQANTFFKSVDAPVLTRLGNVSTWVNDQQYTQAAINTFLQVADYYLVGYALAHSMTIVTHEVPANSPNKIKIPDVCLGMGINCINPYAMLRREQAHFVLQL